MSTNVPLSVCIITFNEETNIGECLESVRWADDIVVVDSFSTDRTVEICSQYTERVIQRRWKGINDQRNFTLECAKHDWVLALDADERVSPELRAEIETIVAEGGRGYVAFAIPRRTYYIDRWIRHSGWYPARRIRLFRKSCAHYGNNDPHDEVIVDGPVGKLRGDLLHYSYRSISEHIQTINQFTTVSAERMFREGRRFRWLKFATHPLWAAFRKFVLQLGFLDGLPGVLIAAGAMYTSLLKYAKLWELEKYSGAQDENSSEH